jgi:hypothetical protein
MARTKAKTPSTRSYFKQVFTEHPEWLEDSSTEAVLTRWQGDHPNQELTASIKSNLSNIKHLLRKQKGLAKKGRRKGKRKGSRAPKAAPAVEATQSPSRRVAARSLEKLEVLIDSCLTHARQQAGTDLAGVIEQLRLARNTVIKQLGEGGTRA